MFNDFQWNCFNLVYTFNIALILFLKCDVTKFRIPLLLVTLRRPLLPLTCDVIYGWPLFTKKTIDQQNMASYYNSERLSTHEYKGGPKVDSWKIPLANISEGCLERDELRLL